MRTPLSLMSGGPKSIVQISNRGFSLIGGIRVPGKSRIRFAVATSSRKSRLAFALPSGISSKRVAMLPTSSMGIIITAIMMTAPSGMITIPTIGLHNKSVVALGNAGVSLIASMAFPNMRRTMKLRSRGSARVGILVPTTTVDNSLRLGAGDKGTATMSVTATGPRGVSCDTTAIPTKRTLAIGKMGVSMISTIMFDNGIRIAMSSTATATVSLAMPAATRAKTLLLGVTGNRFIRTPSLAVRGPMYTCLPTLPSGLIQKQVIRLRVIGTSGLAGMLLGRTSIRCVGSTTGKMLVLGMPTRLGKACDLGLVSSGNRVTCSILIITGRRAI